MAETTGNIGISPFIGHGLLIAMGLGSKQYLEARWLIWKEGKVVN